MNTNVTNDRYIPNRTISNMEKSYHLLYSTHNENEKIVDTAKKQMLIETCNGIAKNTSVLHLRKDASQRSNGGEMHKKNISRLIPTKSERILDAPEFKTDFYLNLIDFSSTNNLAVALAENLYLLNATNGAITHLFSLAASSTSSSDTYISSVAWLHKGNVLAAGNSNHVVEVWDANQQVCLRQMQSHKSRIASLSWNGHLLSSGSQNGDIHHHDVRVARHHVATHKLHTSEVCGLKWSPDGRYLASGGNDNLVSIWDLAMTSTKPVHLLREHVAAVKALAWCPWQTNLLATGGGAADMRLKIWDMNNNCTKLHDCDSKSQISGILWSRQHKELITSHGYPNNNLTIWKYPSMSPVADLVDHTGRVLGMTLSPDEETVVSVGADETIRFWKCFAIDEKVKKSKKYAIEKRSRLGLTIR